MNNIFYLLILLTLFGCGVPEEQYNTLKNENLILLSKIDTLTNQLNDLKFGADALLKKAQLKIEDKDYEVAKVLLTNIIDKYYNSKEAFTAKKFLNNINPLIEEATFTNAQNSEGTSLLEDYIQQYPDGIFVPTAKSILEEREWQSLIAINSKTDLENFIEKYPTSNYIAEAKNLLIKYEVNDIFNSGNYSQLPPLTKTHNIYSEYNNGNSKISIENNTNYLLTILYSGPEQQKLTIPNNQTENIWLKSGSYRVVAVVDASNVSKYAGEEELDGEYSSSYHISSTYSYSNYSNNKHFRSNSASNYNGESASEAPAYRPQSDHPVYKSRVGAVCCDGTRSYATGQGACSHHRGVCQWLYK
jgi:hypothetical protein